MCATPISPAWFALRRTLPPWRFEPTFRELLRNLKPHAIDEVIVKLDTEEFSHGQPSLAWIRAYLPRLVRVRRELARRGVAFSLNPWITVGHCDRGRDDRKRIRGYRTTVGHDGTVCAHCACPLSAAWRGHIAKLWTIYASLRPRVIWIEDDIRTFNHKPVQYGCFCPEHMRRFSGKAGRKVAREELVAALLKPGRPHPWRALYLDLQAEVMIDTVAFLARAVHKASPSTCLGLMSSGPRIHAIEGRRWSEFAAALGDGAAIFSRPPMGSYHENSLRDLYYSHDSIKLTRHCMPPGSVELTEVENVPFTQYSKSAAFTFVEVAISLGYGAHGVTLNLYDHAGSPMAIDPLPGPTLAARKRWLEAVGRACQAPGPFRGVQLLFDRRESYHRRLPPGANYCQLSADGYAMMEALEGCGIPTTYEREKVAATSGQTLRALDDEAIRRLLRGGLLLDAGAAQVLAERGFGEAIGLTRIDPPRPVDSFGPLSAEEFFNRRFGGAPRKYLTLTLPNLGRSVKVSRIQPGPGAEIVSSFVDPDTRRGMLAMYAFRNRWSGRVVVSALQFNSALGPAFFHPYRRAQLQGAVRWLACGRPSLFVEGPGAYPLALRKDSGGGTILGFFNLTLDPWAGVRFTLGDVPRPARVKLLDATGRWVESRAIKVSGKGRLLVVDYTAPVLFDAPVFIELAYKRLP